MKWVLLLRAVNVGGRNTVPMKELKALLEKLGHQDVKTVLNSGNATFTSSRTSGPALADEIERGLRERLAVDVRACVRTASDIGKVLDSLPALPGYVVVGVLFNPPSPADLKAFLATERVSETVVGNAQVLYIGYHENVHSSKLTNVKIEQALGVNCTARTPATLAKLL